ncbi:MAG TPA: Zn-ribbon domain-containing OB-fold protein [Candidatus Angelobacter sp.]|nr:Zn-ribbon domain-containing OB-fold protein [Candidatus Angelobacter sp.]
MQRIAADVSRPQGGDAQDGAARPPRPLPELDLWNRAFWTGGAEGRLMIARCASCGYWLHPPGPVCPECLSREVGAQEVSGRGTVNTFTVNHQPWHPAFATPYVIALVELDEQPQLRLVTNLVDCDPAQLRIGMPVEVCFEQVEDVFIPLFRPVGEPA